MPNHQPQPPDADAWPDTAILERPGADLPLEAVDPTIAHVDDLEVFARPHVYQRYARVLAGPRLTITLCGSSRFVDAFELANLHLSVMGHVVIGLGAYGHADHPRGARHLTADGDETTPVKMLLDELHRTKIRQSDAIFVVNVGGYVGTSTRREIDYARGCGKRVVWMFPDAIPADLGADRG